MRSARENRENEQRRIESLFFLPVAELAFRKTT
jgi:hypothetical protein